MATVTRLDPARKGEARYYEIDGVRYPSVTSVLNVVAKPALIPWARNVALQKARAELYAYVDDPLFGGQRTIERSQVDYIIEAAKKRPDEVRDQAADLGTRAHTAIDALLQGERPVITPDIEVPIEAFLTWRGTCGFELTKGERVVWSKQHGYAGTLDGLGIIRDKAGQQLAYVVLDWKTSNGLYDEFKMQVAAYALALWERETIPVSRAIIVRFGKDKPDFEVHELSGYEIRDAFEAFLGALAVFKWQHRKKGLEAPDTP